MLPKASTETRTTIDDDDEDDDNDCDENGSSQNKTDSNRITVNRISIRHCGDDVHLIVFLTVCSFEKHTFSSLYPDSFVRAVDCLQFYCAIDCHQIPVSHVQ